MNSTQAHMQLLDNSQLGSFIELMIIFICYNFSKLAGKEKIVTIFVVTYLHVHLYSTFVQISTHKVTCYLSTAITTASVSCFLLSLMVTQLQLSTNYINSELSSLIDNGSKTFNYLFIITQITAQ